MSIPIGDYSNKKATSNSGYAKNSLSVNVVYNYRLISFLGV